MATLGRRRAYGQHFLRDKTVATRIAQCAVEAAEESGCSTLLEIGPGSGAITEPIFDLLKKSEILHHVILCEKDGSMAHQWSDHSLAKAKEGKTAVIHESDFLDLDESKWLDHAPLVIASNLPYSAGTAIFTRLAKHPEKIKAMVLMFQAEVAMRLRAEIGTKSWGSLSIWTQNRWDVTKLMTVPPGAFQPPPEVTSEVVVLIPRKQPRITFPANVPNAEALWDSLLKTSFLHRRKMLRAGLPKSGPIRKALELSGLDLTKRAEALDWSEWDRLFQALVKAQK
jgi:16S rRNA (adenine1518-N6/adenine1519-N6)-dimethyltransferase